jgi:hypothetical protein
MRLWGIRIAILTSIVAMNILEGIMLRPLIRATGINLESTLVDELLLGILMGIVVCCIHEAFRRRYERKLQASVDELNHHVRNSLQVILNRQELCPHCQPSDTAQAMERVEWALKEVLPRELQPRRG